MPIPSQVPQSTDSDIYYRPKALTLQLQNNLNPKPQGSNKHFHTRWWRANPSAYSSVLLSSVLSDCLHDRELLLCLLSFAHLVIHHVIFACQYIIVMNYHPHHLIYVWRNQRSLLLYPLLHCWQLPSQRNPTVTVSITHTQKEPHLIHLTNSIPWITYLTLQPLPTTWPLIKRDPGGLLLVHQYRNLSPNTLHLS